MSRASAAGHWGLPVAAAVLAHAALLVGLRPVAARPLAAGATAAGRVVAAPAEDAGAPREAVFSPAVFALPTPAGFSGGAAAPAPLRAPLDLPGLPPRFLPEPEAAGPQPAVGLRVALAEETADRGARWRSTAPPPGPAAPPAPEPPSTVEWPHGWDSGSFAPGGFPPEAAGAKAWEATVRLEFDARGEPRHVWIEPGADPLPDGVRAALDRGLRRWRLAPGVPVRRGDVRIRYQPGAPWTAFGIPSDPG